jgi:tetraacyldisaccharide 4'-kinase
VCLSVHLYNLATDKYKGLVAAVFKLFLFLCSLLYGLIVKLLILFSGISSCRLNCKIISVGNITLGGTGKTVLVEFIARYLKQKGQKVAILSRGYGRRRTRYAVRHSRYEDMGDEPFMLQQNLKDIPVIVDTDRCRAAKLAMRDYNVDTVILDDGFQQWRIRKDLDIVAVHAITGFGNKKLIPRGILREPLSSLKRADVFVLTNTDLSSHNQNIKELLFKINARGEIFESVHSPLGFHKIDRQEELLKPEILKGKTVAVVCGIGNPDSFQNLIAKIGITIGLSFIFSDHHRYSKKDWEKIAKESQNKNISTVVTTEKDAVRLSSIDLNRYGFDILVLRVELKIKNDEQRFYHRLLGIYSV